MKKLIMTTNNQNKIKEIREILSDFPLSLCSYTDVFDEHIEPIEDGETFEENALIKVACYDTDENAFFLGEDSGIEVNALNGEPGIHSARFCGRDSSYERKCQEILARLENAKDRGARFVSVVAMKFPDGSLETYRGTVEGDISFEMKGANGFGYDPIFIPRGFDITFGEMATIKKHRLSHRYNSLMKCRNGKINSFFE